MKKGWGKAKGWLKGLGLLKGASGLADAAQYIYPECSMSHRSVGAIRLEDQD